MTDTSGHSARFAPNPTLVKAGGALIALGGLLGLLGMALGSTAMITACRRWVKHMDVPPSEIAREKLARARMATSAGMNAWRGMTPHQRTHSPR